MSKAIEMRKITLAGMIRDERKWIDEHGGNLSGYLMRYGRASHPDHYGDGGEAIYAADRDKLNSLLSEMEALTEAPES